MLVLFKREAENWFYTEKITCLISEKNGFAFACCEGKSWVCLSMRIYT